MDLDAGVAAVKWPGFAHSGFWRWYAVSRRYEAVTDDGTRWVGLSVPAYKDCLEIEVSVAPDETVRSVSAGWPMSWTRDDSPVSAAAIVCISSLLRSLEPHDAFVWHLRAALLSRVGLGPSRFAESGASEEVALEAVGEAILGGSEGLQVALAQGGLLRIFTAPNAVAIEWLAAPSGRVSNRKPTIHLPPHRRSAGAAREFVASVLEDRGWTEHVATAVLLTSELVTNAIVHARSDLAVTVSAERSLRVEVFDASPLGHPRGARLDAGRGLRLVDALATSWGVSPIGRGKAVWFELAYSNDDCDSTLTQ